MILRYLRQKDIPMILVGSPFSPNMEDIPAINTSDSNDLEEITDHLLDVHGFRDLDMLTGHACLEASQERVQGFRRSLEKHGIPFDESKIHYGDFWETSGQALTRRYLDGELPMPEAVVCANDYMAFGVLDEFVRRGFPILHRFTVTGYEFIPERHMHFPLLTTYRRNRRELGKMAVQRLFRMLRDEPLEPFVPPKGSLIHGRSCPCGIFNVDMQEELDYSRSNKTYDAWNMKAQFDQKLTECTSIEEIVRIMGEFQFLVRYVQDISLCLFEDWFSRHSDSVSDVLRCQSVMPWMDGAVNFAQKLEISCATSPQNARLRTISARSFSRPSCSAMSCFATTSRIPTTRSTATGSNPSRMRWSFSA